MKLKAYFKLMRFDKPVGIYLLWLPTAWALWLANQGLPSPSICLYFFIGTVIMRAAGCVVNDIVDRHIDKHVRRTRQRPLTSGEISLKEAFVVLIGLLLIALFIALQLPAVCFYYSVLALAITIFYPFCKRFFQAPQLVLGLAFSMAIPMVYSASGVGANLQMFILMVLNIAWIIAYDTMYAMVDRADDIVIGVRSTAILFAKNDCFIIGLLQVFFHTFWFVLALKAHFSAVFYVFWSVGGLVLLQQQRLVNSRLEIACFKAFRMNVWYGAVMWAAILGAYTDVQIP